MKAHTLGYNQNLEDYRTANKLDVFNVGRIVSEHKERYQIKTNEFEYEAELIGNLRYTATNRRDFPAVGDWVAFSEYDEGKALIHAIYPRHSIIERKAVGKTGQVQIIATNIDFGLIVQAVDRDFNLNRVERYLTICNASNVKAIIVLSKVDLIDDDTLSDIINQLETRIKNTTVICVSMHAKGYSQLTSILECEKTYCLLGSSGVGKSTLLNHLAGKEAMKTGAISSSVNKGRHVTSHRELIVLDNGSIIIDNPGMREVGIADSTRGLEITFDLILTYAKNCRYSDCTHLHEKGCAIIEAVNSGQIDEASYANFQKMEKEKTHFESDQRLRKKKDKDLGKIIKTFKKQRKDNKY